MLQRMLIFSELLFQHHLLNQRQLEDFTDYSEYRIPSALNPNKTVADSESRTVCYPFNCSLNPEKTSSCVILFELVSAYLKTILKETYQWLSSANSTAG